MHLLWFQSDEMLNALPRALDVVRRMGFDLCGLVLDGDGVTMTFRTRGDLTAANLADRLRQTPGISALTLRPALAVVADRQHDLVAAQR